MGDVSASGGVVRRKLSSKGERSLQTTDSNGYLLHPPPFAEGEVTGSEMEVIVIPLAGTWALLPTAGLPAALQMHSRVGGGGVTTGRS